MVALAAGWAAHRMKRGLQAAANTTLARIVAALRIQYPDAISVSPDGSLLALKELDSTAFTLEIVRRSDHVVIWQVRQSNRQIGITWRPDSRGIAYFADSGGDQRYGLHVVDFDHGGLVAIDAPRTSSPIGVWSPDGDRLAYIVDHVRRPGRALTVLQVGADTGVWTMATGVALKSGMAWSPNGKEIAVSLRSTSGQISIVSASGRLLRRLPVVEYGELRELLWPPKSACSCILATSRGVDDEFVRLRRVPLSGGPSHVIGPQSGDITGIMMLGGHLGYGVSIDGETKAVLSDLSGTHWRFIGDSAASTTLFGYSGTDNEILANALGRTSPPRLVEIPVGSDGASAFRATPSLENRDTGRFQETRTRYVAAERIDLVSTAGFRIPAYLWRARTDGNPPRALILLHGGPALQLAPTWDGGIQYAVRSGLSVLGLNYRGSVGYGAAFEAHGDDLTGQIDDVFAAAAYVRSVLNVTPEHTVLWGHSYGAWLVANALVKDPAIAGRVIIISMIGDLPAVGRERKGPQVFAFHGRQDVILSPKEARTTLQQAFGDKAVTFTTFADEGHSFRRIRSWADVYLAALAPSAQMRRNSAAIGSRGK